MLAEWAAEKQKVESKKNHLAGADLSNLKLMEANLSQANLAGADLSSTYLIKADLSNADLSGADLSGTIFSDADLSGANLEGADTSDAFFNGANLTGARGLTCDQVALANIDRETRFPDYIQIAWGEGKHYECCEPGS
ncbi:MAG: hypothetical protein COV67_14580 [Nitrospinae bacterium CG11_big_fil_rev_8_21_14_0_20_56_8]|nr:MAG: hypothetical protein COV67_14580 [Nitrospinae bacterium CG11_big_fil_rev_8_21_14_0_20_56_8]